MLISEEAGFSAKTFFSWQFLMLKVLLLVILAMVLEKPTGSLSGRISLGQKLFGLQTYDIKGHHVYAVVEGPREGQSVERGVWVNDDGTFKLEHLPVGEYQLRVRAKGYESVERYGLFVQEGKVTQIPNNIAMDVLQPSVSLGGTTRVFTTLESPTLSLRMTDATDADVKLYKVDFLKFKRKMSGKSDIYCSNDLSIYKNYQADLKNPFDKEQPLSSKHFKVDLDYSDSGRANVDFGKLPSGDYVAYAEAQAVNGPKKTANLAWFTVTNLGLVVKADGDNAIVRAIDLVSLKPVAGCKIKGLRNTDDVVDSLSATTDAQGLAQIKTGNAGGDQIYFVGYSANFVAYGSMFSQFRGQTEHKTYFYTDRPVYRLGQKVFFRGIVREETNHELKNPGAGLSIPAEIDSPTGDKIWEGDVTTNAHGAFNGSFDIPADGKTGGYNVKFYYGDNDTSYCAFEVEEYRKPEYQVEVSALTPRVVAGEQGRAQVKATYFFGAPVANASIKYSVYASTDYQARWRLQDRPSYYSFFDGWASSDDTYGAGGEMITSGTAQTDANGLATITFDTQKIGENAGAEQPYDSETSDKKYRVEAEVTDISRLTQVGSGSCEVTAGDFAVFVQPRQYVVQTGEQVGVDIQAIDYDGKPVANKKIDVRMSRWKYDSVNHQYKNEERLADAVVTTGPDGKTSASIFCSDQWPSDTFSISAITKDDRGHKIFDRTSVWVSNYKYPYALDEGQSAKQPVTLTLDKEVYKVGDKARIMISGPVTGKEDVTALVTIEGTKLFQHKVVPLKATSTYVEFPITKDLVPNAYVDIAFVGRKHQFYTAEQMFKVSPENNFLKIAVSTDKERYHPGDTVTYTIKATHNDGTPAPKVDLSLGVVDESIYAIRAEQAENIQKFFYERRNNLVRTVCSFPELYSGGPDKIEPKVRKDFKDTAAWIPDLITDETGTAVTKVKLPDNLTTWRATVRGVDMALSVGSTTQKILCTQDLILRLALPRFFDQDDHGFITAIVHNYTKDKQPIKLTLSASDQFAVETPLTQNADVEPEKAFRYSWPVTVTKAGIATIRAKAIGRTAGDAMEQKLPIRALALPAFTIRTGVLKDENAEVKIPLKMAGDAMPGTESGELHVAASTIGPVLGNFDQLIMYPYGCTEQTMSRLVPSIVAMELHKQLNLPISSKDQKKFSETQKAALDKLRGYHHSDGGWGWWTNDDSNPYLTCYVVSGLSLLKEVDYAHEDELVRSGLQWLAKTAVEGHKQLSDPKLVPDPYYHHYAAKADLCRMIYTLSEWSETPKSMQDLSSAQLAKPGNSGKSAASTGSGTGGAKSRQGDGYLHFLSEVLPIDFAALPVAPKCEVRSWLVSQRNSLTPEALVYLTLACKNLHDDENAKLAYARLNELSQTGADMVNWDHTSAMAKTLGCAYDEYDYRFTPTETTALALMAVLEMEPDNFEKIERIKRWVLLQRDQNGWQNTKTTSQVFLALLKEELQFKSKQHEESDFAVKAISPGKELLDLMYNSANIYAAEKTVAIKPSPSAQDIDLVKTGPGRLYYTSVLNYMRKLMPGDLIASKGFPSGLKITRKFYRLKASTAADGSIKFHSEEIADHKLKAGETIMMKTLVESPVSLPYVMIEAALPSGAEVVKDSREQTVENPNEESTSEDGTKIEGDWSAPWWTHEDVLDDRIVYFGASLPQGKSEFHSMLRMELPGKLEVLPITLQGMYTEKIRAYSPLDELQVTE